MLHDFMFQLNGDAVEFMVSQNAIPSRKVLGGALPYVFTEPSVIGMSVRVGWNMQYAGIIK